MRGEEVVRMGPYKAARPIAVIPASGRFRVGLHQHKERIRHPMIRERITPWREVSWG